MQIRVTKTIILKYAYRQLYRLNSIIIAIFLSMLMKNIVRGLYAHIGINFTPRHEED